MRHNTAKLVVGLIIVFVGLNLILKAAGIEFSLFFTGWWAVPIILVAIISISGTGVGPWNFGLLVLGAWLLAEQRNWIPDWFDTKYVVGAAIIGFGLLFIFNPRQQQRDPDTSEHAGRTYEQPHREPRQESAKRNEGPRKTDDSDNPSYTAVFAGQEIRNASGNLDGCTMFALFGGLTVDLRDACIDHDIVIDASAVFGGIDIHFPPNVHVVTRATPLFGGVDNKTKKPAVFGAPTVTVRCLAAFGGVDIS
ncbi:MAG: LiaF-related protein [Sphaerochaetaceae bacterium]|jgi:predicted membrane protein|nr:LiaF-related protein [Sphaerochaetaceae bacterium]MDD3942078.1 LiaF-related protein [Sphaerochaetaceae bacterium]MDX9940208.1 LiaF-related protein [Sphaerochaetaceae bacterium]